jgi:hypothetical protein
MMARATAQGPRRKLPLGGLLLLGLLACLASVGHAQGPAKPGDKKADPKQTADKKEPAPKDQAPAWPTFPKLTIVAKSQDVPQVVHAINEKLEAAWKANNIVPADYCTDHEFIRRASLDIVGRIATPEEIAEFLKDPKETRRSLLIDRLLSHPEYSLHWSNVWTNWLLSRSGQFGRGTYHEQLNDWLKEQFALNRHFDDLVRDLLTAKGTNTDNGAVNFILAHMGEQVPAPRHKEDGQFEMVPLTSRITRLFLGVQVQCAQCHDHPFQNHIKQKHFWGINAFLRQIERDPPPGRQQPRQMAFPPLTLRDNTSVNEQAVVFYEKRNAVVLEAKAEFLPQAGEEKGARLTPKAKGLERRADLARFVIEHEMFPKAQVNRLWGAFLGKGIVNPVDDFNDQNAPSMPEMLNELASQYKNYGYDQKKLIRWICNSHAYNLSCTANKTNDKPEQEAFFSRAVLKSMAPEQLLESLVTATHMEAAASADKKKDLRNRWLDSLVANFGDDEGNEVSFNGTVVQALMMMNGKELNEAVAEKNGTVAQVMKKHPNNPRGIITELYLTTLNREPTRMVWVDLPTGRKQVTEVEAIVFRFRLLKAVDRDPAAPYQDLFWALLNCNEFLLNH